MEGAEGMGSIFDDDDGKGTDDSWTDVSIGSRVKPTSTKPSEIASDDISRLKNEI